VDYKELTMVIGQLVKEDCSNPDKCRLGTMVKVTKYNLASNSDWHKRSGENDSVDDYIRSGHVVSVRWQDNPTKLTTHVFYDGIEGSVMNLMAGNTIMAIL
jgi:hypothetical protein